MLYIYIINILFELIYYLINNKVWFKILLVVHICLINNSGLDAVENDNAP